MSMVRVRSVDIIKHIAPHLVFTDECLRAPFLQELAHGIMNSPDSLLILASFEGKEIRAFLIASNPGATLPYVMVAQTWSHPSNPSNWYEPFLAKLILWATAHDKEYIKAETPRNADAMFRRFGFEQYMTVLKFKLKDEQYHSMILEHIKELLDG